MVSLLQGLAKLLDKYVPGQGARTWTIVALTAIAHISLFLIGKETAQEASTGIASLAAVVFAALHKTPPAPPM